MTWLLKKNEAVALRQQSPSRAVCFQLTEAGHFALFKQVPLNRKIRARRRGFQGGWRVHVGICVQRKCLKC